MTHVQLARRVREHRQAIVFRATFGSRTLAGKERLVFRPPSLGGLFHG
jgi:hypothetical protein